MNTAPASRAVVASAAVLLLTSCGSLLDQMGFLAPSNKFLEQSPRSIAKASFADMQDVTSMRILGDVETARYGRVRVDVSVDANGCQGSLETAEEGGFQLRQNEDGTWARADEKFWQTQADTRQQGDLGWKMFHGQRLAVDGKDDYLKLCDLDKLLGELELEPEDTEESLGAEEVVEVGDSDAVPITGGRRKKRNTIWVSVDAPHRVLKMAPAKDTGLPDALYFEEFGLEVIVETPAKNDIAVIPKGQSPV